MKPDLIINQKKYESESKLITGSQILQLGQFLPVEDFDLYKKIINHEFEPIQLEETVNLEEPGIEYFTVERKKELTFFVDDEPYSSKKVELQPIEIFGIIGLSSEKFYLKKIEKHKEITYKEDLNCLISMLDNPKFITCSNEPATVSGGNK